MAGLPGSANFQLYGLPAQHYQPQQTPGRPCLLCLDILPPNAKGQRCHQGHFYCEVCIRTWFEAALVTENEGWRPPQCCGQYMPPDPTIFPDAFVVRIERKNEDHRVASPAPGAAPAVPGPEDSRPFRLAQPAHAWEITEAARMLQGTQAARAAQVVQAAQALHAAEALRMAEGVQTDQLLRIAPALQTAPGLQATRLIDEQISQLLQAFGVLHGPPNIASRLIQSPAPRPVRTLPAAPTYRGATGLINPAPRTAQSMPAAPAPQGSQDFLTTSHQPAQFIRAAPGSQSLQMFPAPLPRAIHHARAAQGQGVSAPANQASQRAQAETAFYARALRSAQAILASQGLQSLTASAPQVTPSIHPAAASHLPHSDAPQD